MVKSGDRNKKWEKELQVHGFRKTAVSYLLGRLKEETEHTRIRELIHRLRKYESDLEIFKALRANPLCGRDISHLAEDFQITENPQVQFVFQGGGNVPNIPAVKDGKLYFGSGKTFYALDAKTGSVDWLKTGSTKSWTTPWVSDDALFVCSGNILYALSVLDGAEKWNIRTNKTLTPPFAHGDKVFVGSEEGTVYAFQAQTGERLWTFNVVRSVFVARAAWQGKIFAASSDHSLYAINGEDGECLWHFTTGGRIYGYPHISDGVVYLPSTDRKIYALIANGGRPIWTFSTGGEVTTSPCELHGVLYATSRDRNLYAISSEDGKELWRQMMLGYPSSPSATRAMVTFSAQGRVYGLRIADQKIRWWYPLGFSSATSPIVDGLRVYVGTLGGRLICLQVKSTIEELEARKIIQELVDKEE